MKLIFLFNSDNLELLTFKNQVFAAKCYINQFVNQYIFFNNSIIISTFRLFSPLDIASMKNLSKSVYHCEALITFICNNYNVNSTNVFFLYRGSFMTIT